MREYVKGRKMDASERGKKGETDDFEREGKERKKGKISIDKNLDLYCVSSFISKRLTQTPEEKFVTSNQLKRQIAFIFCLNKDNDFLLVE